MKFFVPHTNDVQGQEQLYRLVRGNVESQVRKVDPRRIWRVRYGRNGAHLAEVGQPEPVHGDDVFAIFLAADGTEIFICTPAFGMFNDRPIVVATADMAAIEDFSTT
jgi:hypothetical protein